MWLSDDQATELVARHGSPVFVYSKAYLKSRAQTVLGLSLPFGHVVRYAVKANSHPDIITMFLKLGLEFDASSSYEAAMLLGQGVPGSKISLSSQQSAHNLPELLGAGVQYVATSMHQLEAFADASSAHAKVALRVNPPLGYAGHHNRLSTGGEASSFGLWHEYLEQALNFAESKRMTIHRLHIHIGSGADPTIIGRLMDTALTVVRRMPDVTVLDIGGGYKVKRSPGEQEANMKNVEGVFSERLAAFADETGRKIQLEIEPGTWLVAHAGVLLSRVDDIVDTGPEGYTFLRLNTGMNDIIRPAMYGAQHEIQVINENDERAEYLVVGHNCETGDILTPAPGDPEHLMVRSLRKAAIGDTVAIYDAGAYCTSFSVKGYNAFPSAAEVFID
jgi:diaminopimelate decarboxylase